MCGICLWNGNNKAEPLSWKYNNYFEKKLKFISLGLALSALSTISWPFPATIWILSNQMEGTPFPVSLFRSAVSRYSLSRSRTILGQTIPGRVPFPVGPFPVVYNSRFDLSRSGTIFGQLKKPIITKKLHQIIGFCRKTIKNWKKLILVVLNISKCRTWS